MYFAKFDPKAHPSLTTGADTVSKNFFHAIGYNVPDAYIVYVRADNFILHDRAVVSLPGGKEVPMDREYLEFMLDNASRIPTATSERWRVSWFQGRSWARSGSKARARTTRTTSFLTNIGVSSAATAFFVPG